MGGWEQFNFLESLFYDFLGRDWGKFVTNWERIAEK